MASKILLVEDDNNLREIYEARLQAEGYTIATAKDGEEALVVAKAEKPDLIISDVMMPRISGFEMLDILRNTDELKYTKVIMLTALGQADDKTRADSLGADRYLVKSQVTLEDIVKAAHELTDAPAPASITSTPDASPAIPAVQVQSIPQPITMATPPTIVPPPQPTVEPVTLQVAMPPADPSTISPSTSQSAPAIAPTPATSLMTQTTADALTSIPPAAPQQPIASAAPASMNPEVQPAPVTPTQATLTTPIPPQPPVDITPATMTVAVPLPQPSPAIIVQSPVESPGAPLPQPTAKQPETATPVTAESRPTYMTDFSSTTANRPTSTTPESTAAPTKEQQPVEIINAASTAEEEATVGEQIANFANAPLTSELPQSVPIQPEASAMDTAHDAMLADAMNNLSANPTDTSTSQSAPAIAPTPAIASPEALSNNQAALHNSVTIANKKIIQPIKTDPKPNLDELMAREDARDATTTGFGQVVTSPILSTANEQAGVTPVAIQQDGNIASPTVPTPQPQTPPNPTLAHSDFDPNNIAL